MDLYSLIQLKRKRFEQLEHDIADPALFSNRQRASEIMREHANVKQLLAKWDELEVARKQLDDNRELAASNDVEIAAMADDEIPDLQKRVSDLERDFQIALLPPDDTGYGFDNIGDVLSVSPGLLERYMLAAAKVLGSRDWVLYAPVSPS